VTQISASFGGRGEVKLCKLQKGKVMIVVDCLFERSWAKDGFQAP